MLEKHLEKKLFDEVKKMGGIAFKFVSPGNNGVPDRIVILPKGRIYFVEMKQPKDRRKDELQAWQQDRIRARGAKVRKIYTEPELRAFIEEAKHEVQTTRLPDVYDP